MSRMTPSLASHLSDAAFHAQNARRSLEQAQTLVPDVRSHTRIGPST